MRSYDSGTAKGRLHRMRRDRAPGGLISPRRLSTLSRLIGGMVTILAVAGCAFVPYDEDMLTAVELIEELEIVKEVGPTAFEDETDRDGQLLRPTKYYPVVEPGNGGYLVAVANDDILIFHDDGDRIRRIGRRALGDTSAVSPYVSRVVATGSDTLTRAEADQSVGIFITPSGRSGFSELLRILPSGEQQSTNLTEPVLEAIGDALGTSPVIVGAYFYAEAADTRAALREYLAMLARDRAGSTFREIRFAISYDGALDEVFSSTAGFTLPNNDQDEPIRNGAYVYDYVGERSYLTVRSGAGDVTYIWSTGQPGADAPAAIKGRVAYSLTNGGVATVDDGQLKRYDTNETLLDSQQLGALEPIGTQWVGSAVRPLFSVVGVSRGIPTGTLSAQLLAGE